ncbi:hypothetical protein GGF32_006493 [Allomyces javanicus]|nr:hypothetical protein GGF32_006493 [Allomyces javanicus]
MSGQQNETRIRVRQIPSLQELVDRGCTEDLAEELLAFWTRFTPSAATDAALRSFQVDILNEILDGYEAGQRTFHVCIPTGAGKSIIMALLPLVLRLGRSLSCTLLQDVNESNSRVYTSTTFETMMGARLTAGQRFLVGALDIARKKSDIQQSIIAFSGSRKLLGAIGNLEGFSLVQVDEVQSLHVDAFNTLRQTVLDAHPANCIVSFSATTLGYVSAPGCTIIQRSPAQCAMYIKRCAALVINTKSISPKRFGYETRQELEDAVALAPGATNMDGCATNTMRVVNEDRFIIKILVLGTFKLAEYLASRSDGRRPGIVIKCPQIKKARACERIISKTWPDKEVRIVDSDMTPADNKKALAEYEAGEVDVLVVVRKLSVGWHCPRTSILVPLVCNGFTDALQFVGRGSSIDPHFERNYVVMSDLFVLATQFPARYNTNYYHSGLSVVGA